MEPGCLAKIAHEINVRSKECDLGHLQEIRKEILGFKRLPAKEIFTSKTIFDGWALQ